MQETSFPLREPTDETVVRTSKLPKWTLPLFIVAMTLCISSTFLKRYWVSEPIGHRLISVQESPDDFRNVIWDELVLIPRMNALASGRLFSDPWNSYNPGQSAWGLESLTAPLIGGSLIHFFGNYFIAMSIWGMINFSLMIILIYNIFRSRPFEFSQASSILGTFLLLNQLWIGGRTFSSLNTKIPKNFLLGFHHSLVMLDDGLFTYLPYILFLFAYWRFFAAPSWRRALFVGGAAGLLTYIYFFHYVFAFSMIAGHMGLLFVLRRKQEALYLAGALGLGLIMAVPSVINTLVLVVNSAPLHFMQRLNYSPGRSPFQDYHWLLRFQIPFFIGIVYMALRKDTEVKWTMVRTWVVLGVAYVMVLHVRVVAGSMQAVDHFWRLSLGIPASLWCILAVFDLVRSRPRQFEIGRKAVYIAAAILPILILARTTAGVVHSLRSQDVTSQLSAAQLQTLEELDCLEQVLKPGEGFLMVDPALNYHTMVNLKGVPFMAMGVSPVSVDELSKRYLLSASLTGQDNIQYPPFRNREAPDYTLEKDLHLYLYVNLFFEPWSDFDLEERIRKIYQSWNPASIDWTAWTDALSTVKAVYVENEYFDLAMERLPKLFKIKKIVSCNNGKTLRVNFDAVYNHRQSL
jgi:hypothetical protein